MRTFKWIEWNLEKISSHALSVDQVEDAFDRVLKLEERSDGSFQMYAETASGRRIWVIWRYDRDEPEFSGIVEDLEYPPIFVITAY